MFFNNFSRFNNNIGFVTLMSAHERQQRSRCSRHDRKQPEEHIGTYSNIKLFESDLVLNIIYHCGLEI